MLTQAAVRELLADAKAGLEALYGERLRGVYLYGSYARNEQHEDSDVDLLVVLDEVQHYFGEIKRTSHLMVELLAKYDAVVYSVFMPERDWTSGGTAFVRSVRRDAIAA